MTQWTDTDPGSGDLGGLTDLAVWLRSTGTGLSCASGSVRAATGVLQAGWSGQTAQAWADRATRVAVTTDQLPGLFATAAAQVMTYVDTVTSIQLRAALARTGVDEATVAVRTAQSGYDAARTAHLRADPLTSTGRLNVNGPTAPSLDATGTALRVASQRLTAAQEQLAAAQGTLSALARERAAADATVTTALGGLTPPGWDATSGALAAGAPTGDGTDPGWASQFTGWAVSLPDTDAGRAALREAVGWLTDEQWNTLLADHPRALVGLLSQVDLSRDATFAGLYAAAHATADSRTAAYAVAAAFAALTPAAQATAARVYPWLVGNLDGVPFTIRGQANLAVLDVTIAKVTQDIADNPASRETGPPEEPPSRLEQQLNLDQARLDMLNAVKTELDKPSTDGGSKSLALLDTTYAPALGAAGEDTGKAAIVFGDLDTASNVAVLVPGLDSFVGNYMPSIAGNAQNIQDTASDILSRSQTPGTVATVGWIGFQEPHMYNVVSDADAKVGAVKLDSFLWGIQANQATVANQDPHLTVLGHSYGSTTAGIAAASDNPIDDLALFGSPGVEARTAAQLQVPAGHVYAEAAQDDLVTWTHWFGGPVGLDGVSPVDPGFGAVHLSTYGGATPLDPNALPSTGHSEYYAQDTTSLYNLSSIVTGHYQNLVKDPGTPMPSPGPAPTP